MATSNLEGKFDLQVSRFNVIKSMAKAAREGAYEDYCLSALIQKEEFLDGYLAKFETLHERLCEAKVEGLTDYPYFKEQTYVAAVEAYAAAKSIITTLREKREESSPHKADCLGRSSLMLSSGGARRSLPKIQLPTFSGSYKEWRPYSDLFSSMVGECPDIDPVEKMYYLKASLSGEAAGLVANIPVSSEAFSRAWATLTRRYENPRLLISAQVDRLVNSTPLPPRSSQALNGLLSEVMESLEALKGLAVPLENWDVILVHLVVRRLDTITREAWENHLGH
ncbi:uncharacterized protein LOC123988887 [Osmia bicornis bicornis]|uniref:uncharacterized protein LOC123988887 n=1 Tax=Osmia bicornis bicornis TaxID=1437191 RepID=UPI001EAE9343|nr:uncharacterized protein LOC123988887 [Osmia bicornis bicornis]